MTIDEQIEVLKAKKEGKKIEERRIAPESDWYAQTEPFDFMHYEYRIVREPREWNIVQVDSYTNFLAWPVTCQIPAGWKIIARAVEDLSAAPLKED